MNKVFFLFCCLIFCIIWNKFSLRYLCKSFTFKCCRNFDEFQQNNLTFGFNTKKTNKIKWKQNNIKSSLKWKLVDKTFLFNKFPFIILDAKRFNDWISRIWLFYSSIKIIHNVPNIILCCTVGLNEWYNNKHICTRKCLCKNYFNIILLTILLFLFSHHTTKKKGDFH